MPTDPTVSVVVPSHERPLRLGALLAALQSQQLSSGRWEAVVVHDSAAPLTGTLLDQHPLTAQGTLRHLRVPPCSPAVKRNLGWRLARAPLIAFTDDDCRPRPQWLERLAAAAVRRPGEVLQGTTRPDPEELEVARRPLARSQHVDPPSPLGQTCNIAYPRELLDDLGGFDERFPVAAGEDTDLLMRALEAGATLHAVPEAVVDHAVTAQTLRATLRSTGRWQHLALVVARHPHLRRQLTLGVFWKPAHAWLALGLGGALLGARRRRALPLALALPWVVAAPNPYGPGWRGRARAVGELPLRALLDGWEMAVAARGAVRYRTPFL